MRTIVALPVAYMVAVAAAPLALYLVSLWVELPFPRGFIFTAPLEMYVIAYALAFAAAFPGFVAGRGVLWFMGTRSALAFLISGAGTGLLAIVLLTWSDHAWVLRRVLLPLTASFVGAVSGLIYWWVEGAIAGPKTWTDGRGKRLNNVQQNQ